MLVAMQIPQFPFLNGPGILRQPQSGSRQQVSTELQVKAQAQGGPEAARPAKTTARSAPGAGVAFAGSLDEAVRALAASDSLPRRGSLIDLKA
jgi:hypothetical protein